MRRMTITRPLMVLAALAALLAAGCTDDDPAATPTPTVSTPATPTSTSPGTGIQPTDDPRVVIAASYANGEITTESSRVQANVGQLVRIEVTSEVAEEIHAHGVDKRADIAPGTTGVLEVTFPAAGRYRVELEKSHKLIVEIEVR